MGVSQTKKALAPLRATGHGRIAYEALLARAQQDDVTLEEVERLVGVLVALAEWKPANDTRAFLPLSLEEAEHVLGFMGFGATSFTERCDDVTILVSTDLRILLVATEGGVEIEAETEFSDESSEPSREDTLAIREKLVARAEEIYRHYTLQAVFGTSEPETDGLAERFANLGGWLASKAARIAATFESRAKAA
jgi:hypothetical protein